MFIAVILLSGIIAIISLCSIVDDMIENFYAQYNERDIKFHSFQELDLDNDETAYLVEDYEYFWNWFFIFYYDDYENILFLKRNGMY